MDKVETHFDSECCAPSSENPLGSTLISFADICFSCSSSGLHFVDVPVPLCSKLARTWVQSVPFSSIYSLQRGLYNVTGCYWQHWNEFSSCHFVIDDAYRRVDLMKRHESAPCTCLALTLFLLNRAKASVGHMKENMTALMQVRPRTQATYIHLRYAVGLIDQRLRSVTIRTIVCYLEVYAGCVMDLITCTSGDGAAVLTA
jgi:hypothetical protein